MSTVTHTGEWAGAVPYWGQDPVLDTWVVETAGEHTISWVLESPDDLVHARVVTPDGTATGDLAGYGIPSTATLTVTLNEGDIIEFRHVININGWGGPGTGSWSITAPAAGTPVTPEAPTFLDGDPWVTLPTVEGVTYTVSGTPGWEQNVTVTATADEGYILEGQSEWSHEWGVQPLPGNAHYASSIVGVYVGDTLAQALYHGSVLLWRRNVAVTPTAPTFHDGEPWITLPTVEGVTYSVSGTPGYDQTVTVAATADEGYEIFGTAFWSHTFGPDPRPVVTITGTWGNESRDQFRQACIDHGTTYDTVEVLPFRLDTSQATRTNDMFFGCSNLKSVPDMDTSKVTSMGYMFYDCSNLTSVPDMDTSQATIMNDMFQGCSSLTQVSNLDTSKARNLNSMFSNCSSLTSVPDLDTFQATNMGYMFNNCSSLTQVSNLDTSKATILAYMFRGCSSLTSVSNLDTSQATNMGMMFRDCSSLTSVSDLDTSQVRNMQYMFYGCASLTDGNVRCIGRHQDASTSSMIDGSGLTREPFYDINGNPI